MSWSVSASGKPAEVKTALEQQFSYPLAEGDAGLVDAGEKETVRNISKTIDQCLETFDPEQSVAVYAYGHMGFDNWDERKGAYQNVHLSIQPSAEQDSEK